MKQFIVLISMSVLGIFLFGLIAGPGEDSLMHAAGESMRLSMLRSIAP